MGFSISNSTKLVAMLSLAALIAACGSDKTNPGGGGSGRPGRSTNVPAGLYGTWTGLPDYTLEGVVFSSVLRIGPTTLGSDVTCTGRGRTMLVKVDAPADMTENTIKVVEAKQSSRTEGGMTCSATLTTDEMAYRLDGDRLTVSTRGESVTLRRRN